MALDVGRDSAIRSGHDDEGAQAASAAPEQQRRLILSDAEVKRVQDALRQLNGIAGMHNIGIHLTTLDDTMALIERLAGSVRHQHDRWLNAERALGQIKEDLGGMGRVLKIALGSEKL